MAVETQVVEVGALVIDDFQPISRCLVTAKAHTESVAEVDEVVASCHCHKPAPSDLLEYDFCYLVVHNDFILSY